MSEIKAIIVDDEQSARNILRSLLRDFCPNVKILSECTKVEEAVEAIKKHSPDVVFLDIEMPEYAGYEIVNFFDQIDFQIIFITAYNQYAVKAFEVAATDYLVKPIEIERLKESVNKLEELLEAKSSLEQLSILKETMQSDEIKRLAIMDRGYRKFIETKQIIAIEAQRAYCTIYMEDGTDYCVTKNIGQFEQLFDQEARFFRTHKSWLVNLDKMESFSKSKAEIKMEANIVAKLSKYKAADFEALMLSK
jgi:two-component system LytT family response regulator